MTPLFQRTSIIAVIVFATSVATGQNLLLNASFDSDDTGGGDVSIYFPGEWQGFNDSLASSDVPTNTGPNVLKQFGPFELNGGTGAFQVFDASAGEVFEASVFSRLDSNDLLGAGNFALGVIDFYASTDGTGDALVSFPFENILNDTQMIDEWIQHSVQGTAPTGTSSVKFTLLHVQGDPTWFGRPAVENPVTGGAIFWDDAVLQRVTQSGLIGDYNEDGRVDAADYTVWRDNVGQVDTLPNTLVSGVVGDAQYTEWTNAYGSISASSAAIPEPTSLSLLLVVGISMIRRRV